MGSYRSSALGGDIERKGPLSSVILELCRDSELENRNRNRQGEEVREIRKAHPKPMHQVLSLRSSRAGLGFSQSSLSTESSLRNKAAPLLA